MIRSLEMLESSKVRRATKTRKFSARKRLKAESCGSGLGTRCFTDSQLITWTLLFFAAYSLRYNIRNVTVIKKLCLLYARFFISISISVSTPSLLSEPLFT